MDSISLRTLKKGMAFTFQNIPIRTSFTVNKDATAGKENDL